jgi:hypothetical protein
LRTRLTTRSTLAQSSPRTLRYGLVVCLLGLAVSAFVAPAAAALTTSGPRIISPAEGSTVPIGWEGPIEIDFSQAIRYGYNVYINCQGSGFGDDYQTGFYYPNDGSPFVESIPAIPEGYAGADCSVVVDSPVVGDPDPSTHFRVARLPVEFTGVVVDEEFYPTVRDGYQDEAGVTINLSRRARVTVRVSDSTGKAVRSVLFEETGSRIWYWNGRNEAGRVVEPGRYQLRITASADGQSVSVVRATEVVTKVVKGRFAVGKAGHQGRPAAKGHCYVALVPAYESAVLNCNGAGRASMTYTLKIPANAKRIVWGARTHPYDGDRCCDGGITRTGNREGPTRFRVKVEATGHRAIVVTRAKVRYSARVRI